MGQHIIIKQDETGRAVLPVAGLDPALGLVKAEAAGALLNCRAIVRGPCILCQTCWDFLFLGLVVCAKGVKCSISWMLNT